MPRFFGAVFVTLFLAMLIKLIPINPTVHMWLPDFLLLVIFHWVLVNPGAIKMWMVWLFGLVIDVITHNALGQYAFTYILFAYGVIHYRDRVNLKKLQHQLILLGLMSFAFMLINFALSMYISDSTFTISYAFSWLSNIIIWAVMHEVLTLFHMRQSRFKELE